MVLLNFEIEQRKSNFEFRQPMRLVLHVICDFNYNYIFEDLLNVKVKFAS